MFYGELPFCIRNCGNATANQSGVCTECLNIQRRAPKIRIESAEYRSFRTDDRRSSWPRSFKD